MMTQSVVMCISKKIAEFLKKKGWKNIGTFKTWRRTFKSLIIYYGCVRKF